MLGISPMSVSELYNCGADGGSRKTVRGSVITGRTVQREVLSHHRAIARFCGARLPALILDAKRTDTVSVLSVV